MHYVVLVGLGTALVRTRISLVPAAHELELLVMHKPSSVATAPRKTWAAPRLSKLGSIADVAQGSGFNVQGQPNRS